MDEERAEQAAEAREENGYLACASCGKLMPASAAFCHVCGASLKAASSQGIGEAAVAGGEGSCAPEVGEARESEAAAEALAPPPLTAPSTGPVSPPYPPYPSREAAYGYTAPPPGGTAWSPYGDYPRSHPQTPSPYCYPIYPFQAPYRARKTDDMAIISLICALVSFVAIPFFPAVAAIALGFASRQRIREAGGRLEGEGLAMAGIIVGIFNVALCLGLLALVVALATGM